MSPRADLAALIIAGVVMTGVTLSQPTAAVAQPLDSSRPDSPPGFPLGASARAILCGPRVTDRPSASTLRLLRSDAGRLRRMYAPDDTIVVSGGRVDGIAPGDLFVVRRQSLDRLQPFETPLLMSGVRTLGVVQILAVSDSLATAYSVEMCDGFVEGDYLEPFRAPVPPVARLGTPDPDYQNAGLVLFGDLSRQIASAGEMMVIDRGSVDAVVTGQTVTVFRQALELGGPVGEVARAIVVEVAESTSTIRIEASRGAVFAGDRVALHPTR